LQHKKIIYSLKKEYLLMISAQTSLSYRV